MIAKQRKYRALGVAFPRSGTLYIARALCALGLDIGHECIDGDGGVGYMYANKIPTEETQDPNRRWVPPLCEVDVVFHFIRNPCKVIPSAIANLPHMREAYAAGWPLFWHRHNLRCERLILDAHRAGCKTLEFRIEDGEAPLRALADLIGVKWDAAAMQVPRDTNHKAATVPLEWGDLPVSVFALARRYGYQTIEAETLTTKGAEHGRASNVYVR